MRKIIKLVGPYFQPGGDLCVSTAIKNVLDTQFGKNILSIKKINKLCKYNGKYGMGICIEKLGEYLKNSLEEVNIKFNEGESLKISSLKELIEKNILPIVYFPIKDYGKWKKKTNIEVESDSEPNLHAVIVVGFDDVKEEVYVFDTIKDKYKKEKDDTDPYDTLSFTSFYEYWEHKGLNYPAIWFTELKKLDEKQQKL